MIRLAVTLICDKMIRDYIETFARRKGRLSERQKRGVDLLLQGRHSVGMGEVEAFSAGKRLVVEIGFGMGEDFLDRVIMYPDVAFIGIDVYPPAVGTMVMNVHEQGCQNVKILFKDAMQVLMEMPKASIDAVHLFFPDPWPKKRHHKRRMALQQHFHDHMFFALKPEGVFYFVSDWQPYADAVKSLYDHLGWTLGVCPLIDRETKSKYEKRGLCLEHSITEFVYVKPKQLPLWTDSACVHLD